MSETAENTGARSSARRAPMAQILGRIKRKGHVKPPKPVDPDEVTLAPKMSEVAFWDALTAPLLAMFADGPMKWSDIHAAVELLGMNPRFEHHAVAWLEQSKLIHHVGAVDVTWFYGPAPEEDFRATQDV